MARLLLVIVLVALAAGAAPVASSHSPNVRLEAYGRAVVDGRLSPDEWDAAASVTFVASTPLGDRPARLFVMNDRRRLSLAVRVEVPTVSWSRVSFFFDSNHDGVATVGSDDAMQVDHGVASGTNRPGHSDEYYCGTTGAPFCFDVRDGGRNDEAAAMGVDGGVAVYEASKPLVGDAHDFAVAAGETLGFLVGFDQFDGTRTQYHSTYWPAPSYTEFRDYGDIVVARVPPLRGVLPVFQPVAPRAGRLFKVARSSVLLASGLLETPDTQRCTALLAGRPLRSSARCAWRLPATARGKRLVVDVTAVIAQQRRSVRKTFVVR